MGRTQLGLEALQLDLCCFKQREEIQFFCLSELSSFWRDLRKERECFYKRQQAGQSLMV